MNAIRVYGPNFTDVTAQPDFDVARITAAQVVNDDGEVVIKASRVNKTWFWNRTDGSDPRTHLVHDNYLVDRDDAAAYHYAMAELKKAVQR